MAKDGNFIQGIDNRLAIVVVLAIALFVWPGYLSGLGSESGATAGVENQGFSMSGAGVVTDNDGSKFYSSSNGQASIFFASKSEVATTSVYGNPTCYVTDENGKILTTSQAATPGTTYAPASITTVPVGTIGKVMCIITAATTPATGWNGGETTFSLRAAPNVDADCNYQSNQCLNRQAGGSNTSWLFILPRTFSGDNASNQTSTNGVRMCGTGDDIGCREANYTNNVGGGIAVGAGGSMTLKLEVRTNESSGSFGMASKPMLIAATIGTSTGVYNTGDIRVSRTDGKSVNVVSCPDEVRRGVAGVLDCFETETITSRSGTKTFDVTVSATAGGNPGTADSPTLVLHDYNYYALGSSIVGGYRNKETAADIGLVNSNVTISLS